MISSVISLADIAVGFVLVSVRVSDLGVIGDLLLVEVGVLAILGGLVEFSRSKGVYEIRRITFGSKEEFSITKHVEASRRAVMFFFAALILFALMIALALIE